MRVQRDSVNFVDKSFGLEMCVNICLSVYGIPWKDRKKEPNNTIETWGTKTKIF